MAEHQTPVEWFRVDYVCDSCGEGFMRPTGVMLASSPPQYPHRCNKCDCAKTFRVQYPHVGQRLTQVSS